jgi:hypothetical protein
MSTFYVMHRIDGDEVIEYHTATVEAAKAKIDGLPASFNKDEFSIWDSHGGMLAWTYKGAWIVAPRVARHVEFQIFHNDEQAVIDAGAVRS